MRLAPGALNTSATRSCRPAAKVEEPGECPGPAAPLRTPNFPHSDPRRHEAGPRRDKASRKIPASGRPRPRPPLRRGSREFRRTLARFRPAGCAPPPRVRAARPRTHSAVWCRPVPAAACGAAGDGGPVPHRPAASIHPRGGLHCAAAAALGAGPAATPAPAAASSLAPVQLNDIVQRHVHFVGHGGRGFGPRIEPARQHAAASLPAPPSAFRRRGPEAPADWSRRARSRRALAYSSRRRLALLLRSRTRHGRFYTFPRGGNGRAGRLVIRWRRCEGEKGAGPA